LAMPPDHHGLGDAARLERVDDAADLAGIDPGDARTTRSSSGSVSPRCATAQTSTPWRRAVSAKSTGKRPEPAMSPTRSISVASSCRVGTCAGGRAGGSGCPRGLRARRRQKIGRLLSSDTSPPRGRPRGHPDPPVRPPE
jgi:hypothetical protein